MDTRNRILVVDDDQEIRRLLGRYLEQQGYQAVLAGSRREFEARLAEHEVQVVVLDVMLPDGSGLDICRDLRDRRPDLGIILLTALKEDVDRIIGLELGADDYLGKPFNPRELVARIKAVLRRTGDRRPDEDAAGAGAAVTFRFDGFTADPVRRSVEAEDGSPVELTGAEFDLLVIFLERPGRVLSRDVLLDLLHGRSIDPFDRSVDVTMSRLRRKLGDAGVFRLFKTVRNGGYQLTAKVEKTEAAT